jgi:uncharacterized protein (DUF1800 family)
MASRKSHLRSWALCAVILALSALPLLAQDDPDPNSPTPVLLTAENSARALTSMGTQTLGKSAFTKAVKIAPSEAFAAGSKVVLYVTNLDLLKGEGATAFRVYAEDKNAHIYRFPVLDLRPNSGKPWIYELTIKLADEIGYWEPPKPDGDLIIYVSWRGLASNSVLLGYGATGGGLKADGRVESAPLSQYSVKPISKTASSDYISGYKWSGDRARFLEQAAFGLSPLDDSQIRRIGLRSWLAYQFDQPYPSLGNPYPDIPLKPTTAPSDCDGDQTVVPDVPATCFRDTYSMYPIQNWFFREAFYGTPQLRHRVSWALSQIWVISGVDTQQSSWMITYHQQLSKNAFGNWRQLMYDMTLNPGMGNYLDMIRSTKTSPNENYPREVLQLFNIGLFMLNPDGTLQLDAQQNPIPTYDQNVVNNFTKVFTGWRDCRTVGSACPNNTVPGAPDYKDPMELVGANHDLTAKTLLSYPGSTTTNIAACSGCTGTAITTYANNSLNQALDNIYNHPNVAPMVSKALIQQLVTSDPTPAYVGRISAVFNANRSNPTQLKEVVKAILLDPEARGDVKTDPRYGKLREPVQLLTNVLREFGVGGASTSGQPPTGQSDGVVNGAVSGLGQNVFNSPTVFNYYQPTYVVPGTTILGPEFGIYTTGTAIGRANMFATYAFNGIGVTLPDRPNGTKIDLTEAQAVSVADSSANQLLDYLNTRMLHGTMSSQMKNAILPAITAISAANSLQRAQTAVYLIASSPQFQVQR